MLSRRLALEWTLVFLAASMLVGLAATYRWLGAVDNRIYDMAAGIAAPPPDERILIVEIDDASLHAFGRWPWPRAVHRRLIEVMTPARPLAVGYDVLFVEPSSEDAALAEAMRRAGNVHLPALVQREAETGSGSDQLLPPTDPLAGAATVGIAEVLLDEDGVVRRFDNGTFVEGRFMPQMAALLARHARPGARIEQGRSFLMHYSRPDAFRRVSFASVAKGEVPAELLRDRIVLVGATADGMGDVYAVPSSAGSLMAGVQIQANLLNALLSGQTITLLPVPAVVLLSLLPTWLVLLAFLRLRPGANLRLALATLIVLALASVALVPLMRVWFPPSAAVLGVLMVYILWGWRRLAATTQFIGQQALALEEDPGISRHLTPRTALSDPVADEASHLQDIIGQLRTLRQFTADVIQRLPDATLVVDAQDQVMLANEAADALFGQRVQGKRLSLVLPRLLEGATRDGSRISRPGGQTLVMTDAPLAGDARIVRLADMTALQRATDEREEVLQFLSHDLRSPHAAIFTLLEARSAGDAAAGPSALAPPLAERIRNHARHGLRLADDFVQLARARRRPIDPEAVDLCDVAFEAADMVWPRAVERGIRIEQTSDEGEIWVMGDRGMLLRAVVNLLDNAVKFGPEGAQVNVAVNRQGEDARLAVSGPGPEMPAGRAERPFALYAEGRDVGDRVSIGLGLAFVQATAHRHGGEAHYRHEAGYGPTFSLVLPLAAED